MNFSLNIYGMVTSKEDPFEFVLSTSHKTVVVSWNTYSKVKYTQAIYEDSHVRMYMIHEVG